jgi:hypothetical protein
MNKTIRFKKQLMKHTQPTVGRTARILSGFAFFRKQSAIIHKAETPG